MRSLELLETSCTDGSDTNRYLFWFSPRMVCKISWLRHLSDPWIPHSIYYFSLSFTHHQSLSLRIHELLLLYGCWFHFLFFTIFWVDLSDFFAIIRNDAYELFEWMAFPSYWFLIWFFSFDFSSSFYFLGDALLTLEGKTRITPLFGSPLHVSNYFTMNFILLYFILFYSILRYCAGNSCCSFCPTLIWLHRIYEIFMSDISNRT